MSSLKDSIVTPKIKPYAKHHGSVSSQQMSGSIQQRPMFKARERREVTYDVVLMSVFLMSVFLLMLLRRNTRIISFYKGYLRKDIKKLGVVGMDRTSMLQYVLSLLIISSFFYLLLGETMNVSGLRCFLYILLISLIFIVSKVFLIFLVGYSFNHRRVGLVYIETNLLAFRLISVILIPVIGIALFFLEQISSFIIPLGIGVLAINLFIQMFLGQKILIQYKFSTFHTFLYLCTLEIVPLFYVTMAIKEFL